MRKSYKAVINTSANHCLYSQMEKTGNSGQQLNQVTKEHGTKNCQAVDSPLS